MNPVTPYLEKVCEKVYLEFKKNKVLSFEKIKKNPKRTLLFLEHCHILVPLKLDNKVQLFIW